VRQYDRERRTWLQGSSEKEQESYDMRWPWNKNRRATRVSPKRNDGKRKTKDKESYMRWPLKKRIMTGKIRTGELSERGPCKQNTIHRRPDPGEERP
jgi:hypothetical protein